MSVEVIVGDCREVLNGMEPESIDAVVCDPPYELAFMGKGWDSAGVSFDPETWRACLRVLKPGGHLLAFGGTRTVHRIAVAIEDAGFEIRDQIVWMYGSGFPKSLDVSKAMDKAAGAEREVVGRRPVSYPDSDCWGVPCQNIYADGGYNGGWKPNAEGGTRPVTAPATDLARHYAGFGTALKPAHEPVIVARKPLIGTVAANVTEYGTGALNIDGCRIGIDGGCKVGEPYVTGKPGAVYGARLNSQRPSPSVDGLGRWPANVALDEDAAAMLDAHSGERKSGGPQSGKRYAEQQAGWSGGSNQFRDGNASREVFGYSDTGGASRFFYVAKASRAERNAGLDGMPERMLRWSAGDQNPGSFQSDGTNRNAANHHPTVKPIALMRWLVRLVTPPGGIVCDPFLGSGSTGCAAVLEGFRFIGIEQDAEYAEIARRRIAHAQGPLFAEGAA